MIDQKIECEGEHFDCCSLIHFHILKRSRNAIVDAAISKIDNLEGQEIVEMGNTNSVAHKNYLLALRHVRVAINNLREV